MKKVVKEKGYFEMLKGIMTKDAFNEKFELSMELVSELTAEEGMVAAEFTDRVLTAEELKDFKL